MSDCRHCAADNWAELERGYRAMLPDDVLEFMDLHRGTERGHSQLIAILHRIQGHTGWRRWANT